MTGQQQQRSNSNGSSSSSSSSSSRSQAGTAGTERPSMLAAATKWRLPQEQPLRTQAAETGTVHNEHRAAGLLHDKPTPFQRDGH